jgi:di/tricarboxylate transporter
MTLDGWITLAILAAAVVLFVLDRVRADAVALGVLALLLLTGIVSPEAGLSGFSHPATVTVAAMFVLSAGLERTGAVDRVGAILGRVGQRSHTLGMVVMMAAVAAVSAFINNTAAVAILLPTVVAMARDTRMSPSKLLIPLSFASLFGGMCTLIGTSTNILVSSLAERAGHAPLGMFELSGMGLILAAAGTVYMLTAGRRLLPDRGRAASELTDEFEMGDYLAELEVAPRSALVGQPLGSSEVGRSPDLDVLALVRAGATMSLPRRDTLMEAGDVLRVHCDLQTLHALRRRTGLRPRIHRQWHDDELETEGAVLIEAVVAPSSTLIGETVASSGLRDRYSAAVLAIRHHDQLRHTNLDATELAAGDALLLEMPKHRTERLRRSRDFVVVSVRTPVERRSSRLLCALAIVAGVVTLAALGVLPIVVAAVAGSLAMVVGGCLRLDEAYTAIDWQVVFLLGGLLSLGTALETTGTAAVLAHQLVGVVGDLGPRAVVAALYLLTSVLTAVMSNNATALLLTPIAFGIAESLGVDPRPLLVTVAFAASASFMTPVGYQTNLLVYGPGSYRFADYLKVGTPLNLLFWLLATMLIPVLWPFG